jgi:RNA polymerase sigma-70 factor (ECF subfamily)
MELSGATDEVVAQAVANGDADAFGILVRRYEEKMLRYARKFLFQSSDIQDVVQEVFVKAYVNIKSFDASRRFSPWLYRIAHNEFINAGRKFKSLPVFAFDLDALFPHLPAKETADENYRRKEIKDLLEKYLAKLSPKYREPLILYYIEEMSYKEIADILKIPVATVGIRLKRGKDTLSELMEEEKGQH